MLQVYFLSSPGNVICLIETTSLFTCLGSIQELQWNRKPWNAGYLLLGDVNLFEFNYVEGKLHLTVINSLISISVILQMLKILYWRGRLWGAKSFSQRVHLYAALKSYIDNLFIHHILFSYLIEIRLFKVILNKQDNCAKVLCCIIPQPLSPHVATMFIR